MIFSLCQLNFENEFRKVRILLPIYSYQLCINICDRFSNLTFLTLISWSSSIRLLYLKTYMSSSVYGGSILTVVQAMIMESALTSLFCMSNIQMISISYWFHLHNSNPTNYLSDPSSPTSRSKQPSSMACSLQWPYPSFGLPASLFLHIIYSQKSS